MEESSYQRLCREAREQGLFPGLVASKLRYTKRLADSSIMAHRKIEALVLTDRSGKVIKHAQVDNLEALDDAASSLLFKS